MSEEITVVRTVGPAIQRDIDPEEIDELGSNWEIAGDSKYAGARVSELSQDAISEMVPDPETNSSGEEIVELSSGKHQKASGMASALPDELEVNPYSERAKKWLNEEELEALKEAQKQEEDGFSSDEDLREKFNQSQLERQKEASQGEELSKDLAHASRSSAGRSSTWAKDPLVDSNEGESSSLSQEELEAAVSAFEDRGGVWNSVAEDIRETELSEFSGSPEDSTVVKHSDDFSKAEITTSDEELISELRRFSDTNSVTILDENDGRIRAKVDKDSLEDHI